MSDKIKYPARARARAIARARARARAILLGLIIEKYYQLLYKRTCKKRVFKMSEINKPISYWLDSDGNAFDSKEKAIDFNGSDRGVEQILIAGPVLKLLREMGEAFEKITDFDWEEGTKMQTLSYEALEKLNTFLASIDKGEK